MGSKNKGSSSSGGSKWSPATYQGGLIFVMTLYFFIFVLHLLDVNVDDGTGLIKAYEEIRLKNMELQRVEQERIKAQVKERVEMGSQEYQGDKVAPWVNPFAQAPAATAVKQQKAEEETKELHDALERSIVSYLHTHADSLESDKVNELVHETTNAQEKLRKRQVFIEERFDAVSNMEASMLPRDYIYRSVFSNPELKDKLAVPPTISELKQTSFLGSLFSSFSIGSSARRPAPVHREQPSEAVAQLRSIGTFASLAGGDKAKNGQKSPSILAIEGSLAELGYNRHKQTSDGPKLPTWVLSFGRKCPSLRAVLAKVNPGHSHALICSAFSASLARRVPFKETFKSLNSNLVQPFYQIYSESDRSVLSELPANGFVVLQKNGAGKPQAVKSIKSILGNSRYLDASLELVATTINNDVSLWDNSKAFNIRTWAVIVRGNPMLALAVDGDAVVSKEVFKPFPTELKESADQTAAMRFPGLTVSTEGDASDVQFETMENVKKNLGSKDADFNQLLKNIRIISSRVAMSLLEGAKDSPSSENVAIVEHICMDLTVAKSLEVKLFAVSSDCPLHWTTPETLSLLTDGVIAVVEKVVTGHDVSKMNMPEGLSLVVDQASNFVYN